jgi:hypothetical protein
MQKFESSILDKYRKFGELKLEQNYQVFIFQEKREKRERAE